MNDNTPFALFIVAAPVTVFGLGVLLGLLGRWLRKPSKRDGREPIGAGRSASRTTSDS